MGRKLTEEEKEKRALQKWVEVEGNRIWGPKKQPKLCPNCGVRLK